MLLAGEAGESGRHGKCSVPAGDHCGSAKQDASVWELSPTQIIARCGHLVTAARGRRARGDIPSSQCNAEAVLAERRSWARERAQRLVREVLLPYLLTVRIRQGSGQDEKVVDVELVDIGGGSGLLLGRICNELAEGLRRRGRTPRFRLWLTDVSPGDPGRFLRRLSRRRLVDSIVCVREDYRRWLDRREPLPPERGTRIVLMSRVLDTFSELQIADLTPDGYGRQATVPRAGWWPDCLPHRCLAPGGAGPGAWFSHRVACSARRGRYSLKLHYLATTRDCITSCRIQIARGRVPPAGTQCSCRFGPSALTVSARRAASASWGNSSAWVRSLSSRMVTSTHANSGSTARRQRWWTVSSST
jgi:hypothetical protein